jgi:disulfide bond formation protein DsbB
MLDRARANWWAVALCVSAALLAGAHAFETFGHLAPCQMCLAQRRWHWGVVAFAAAAMTVMRRRPGDARWLAFLIGLLYLGSFVMAAKHTLVEWRWLPETCEFEDVGPISFRAPVTSVVRCDTPQWHLFGLTMANYNALISLAMAGLSGLITVAPERNSKD